MPEQSSQEKLVKLSQDEAEAVKAALLRLSNLLSGPVTILQNEAAWVGSGGNKLAGRIDELPKLRDRARDMANELGKRLKQ